MNIALKHGLLITLVVACWVLITRFLFSFSTDSPINVLAPIVFNLAALISIYLGIKRRVRERGGNVDFKDSLKTGVAISAVYGASASLFFLTLFLVAGRLAVAGESLPHSGASLQAALLACAGLFFMALFLGLIYSALISFVLALHQRNSTREVER